MDISLLARTTAGFSGADLANLVNTAAVQAALEARVYISLTLYKLYIIYLSLIYHLANLVNNTPCRPPSRCV